ncbi:hypothetical protein FRC04_004092 [Tulasnella sp. 424]|nr:hypothetical protein FRC04_004092 [Tulasnella sp. 424]KAG8967643.1 hypothetical protein FRC05_001973 [Tulasnella sp. 425]
MLALSKLPTKTKIAPSAIRLASRLASDAYFEPASEGTSKTPENLTPRQRQVLSQALRVDQAGELAANTIYQGQHFVLGQDRKVGDVIQEMWDQEKRHLKVMNQLQRQHHIRPTALWEVARVAGWGLGAATAMMSKEAAMACTEAVETAIGEHYNDQLKELEAFPQDHPSIPLLRQVIEEFRDDELEHLDTAIDHDSQKAPAHALLTAVIQKGCEFAIEACKRV